MSLSRSSDIDRFCASSHSKKALKMNLFGKMAMRPNWLIHKLETSAMLHYPNSGIFWVVYHIHVDHMDRSFVFSFSLREVFQCLVINLNEISSELDERAPSFTVNDHLFLHREYYVKLFSALLEPLRASLKDKDSVNLKMNATDITLILLFLSIMWSIPFFV